MPNLLQQNLRPYELIDQEAEKIDSQTAFVGPNEPDVPAQHIPDRPLNVTNQSISDVTQGAFRYGASETAGALAGYIDRSWIESDSLKDFSQSMRNFRRMHPEYAPTEVKNTMDLISSPKALSSRVFGNAAYGMAQAGLSAIPKAGWVMAASLSYAVESQREYEKAIQNGASEQQAANAARMSGVINSGIQLMTDMKILRIAKGEKGYLYSRALAGANKYVRSVGGTVEDAARIGLFSALQGGVNEGIATMFYEPKDDPKGFWDFIDRRMQDVVTGGVTGTLMGHGLGKIIGSEEPGQIKKQEIPLTSSEIFKNSNKKAGEAMHGALNTIADAMANRWGEATGNDPEMFYHQANQVREAGKELSTTAVHYIENGKLASRVLKELVANQTAFETISSLMDTSFKLAPDDVKVKLKEQFGDEHVLKKAFLTYLYEGHAPTNYLVESFESTKQMMKRVVKAGADVGSISNDQKAALDQLLWMDTDQVSFLRARLKEFEQIKPSLSKEDALVAEKAIQDIAKMDTQLIQPEAPKSQPVKYFDSMTESVQTYEQPSQPGSKPAPTTVKTQRQVADRPDLLLMNMIRKYQLGQHLPEGMSPTDRRSSPEGWEREIVVAGDSLETRKRNVFQRAWTSMSTIWSRVASFDFTDSGRQLVGMLGDHDALVHQDTGAWAKRVDDVVFNFGRKDRQWWSAVDEDGFTNAQRLLDPTGVPVNKIITQTPSAAVDAARALNREINTEFGERANKIGVVQRIKGGSRVFELPRETRMLRFLTDEIRGEVVKGHGPVYDEFIRVAKRWNPELEDMSQKEISSVLKNFANQHMTQTNSALETARKIKIMPAVLNVNGNKVEIFKTEPTKYFRTSVRVQAQRIAWKKVFNDYGLDDPKVKLMKSLTDELGITPKVTDETLRTAIQEKLGGELKGLYGTSKELRKLAKYANIPLKPTRADFIDAIADFSFAGISKKNAGQIKAFAKKLGGLDLNEHPANLLSQIKDRLFEHDSRTIETLIENIAREGGSAEGAGNVITMAQGIPITEITRNPLMRGIRFSSNVIGTLQTSMQAAMNVFQTAVQLPMMAGVKNYIGAMDTVLKNYKGTKAFFSAMGAIPDTRLSFALERGYVLEGMGRALRQGVSIATFAHTLNDFNNVVAAEVHRRMADQIRKTGVEDSDLRTIKSLGLSDRDMRDLKSVQKLDPDRWEFLRAKIIQRGVASSQFTSEASWRKGTIESNPYLSMLFSYSSYALGTFRRTTAFVKNEFMPAVEEMRKMSKGQKPDMQIVGQFVKNLSVYMIGSLGAGLGSQVIRDFITADGDRRLDDSATDKAIAAFYETQVLGPFQRFIDSKRFDQDRTELFVTGMIPQFKFMKEVVGLMFNTVMGDEYGRMGRFPISEQGKDFAKNQIPLVKGLSRWLDVAANPDLPAYEESRTAVAKFKKDVIQDKSRVIESQINPDYYAIFQAAARGDEIKASKLAQEFYTKSIDWLEKNPEEAAKQNKNFDTIIGDLRQSLMKRAPIDLTEPYMVDFLNRQTPAAAQRYLAAQMRYTKIVDSITPN